MFLKLKDSNYYKKNFRAELNYKYKALGKLN